MNTSAALMDQIPNHVRLRTATTARDALQFSRPEQCRKQIISYADEHALIDCRRAQTAQTPDFEQSSEVPTVVADVSDVFRYPLRHIQRFFVSCQTPLSQLYSNKRETSGQGAAVKSNIHAGLLVDHVPELYREPYLKTGYRLPGCTISECLRSVLQLNNETFNFWTHFLPSMWFAALLTHYWFTYPPTFHYYMIPFYLYLSTIIGYQVVSSLAHCLNAMSETARHVCFGFDYFACSLYAFGCAVAGVYAFIPAEQWFDYSKNHLSGFGNGTLLPDSINTPGIGESFSIYDAVYDAVFEHGIKVRWFTYREYIYLAVPCSVFSTAIACGTRLLSAKDKQLRSIGRAAGFAIPYLYAHAPILMRLTRYPGTLPGDYYHMIQFVSTLFGVFFFCSRIPERLVPYSGRFDVFGHSHMLFHIASVCTTGAQMVAVRLDMFYQWKQNPLAVDAIQQSVEPILWAFAASYFAGLCVVGGFALLVCRSCSGSDPTLKRRLSSAVFGDIDCGDGNESRCAVSNGVCPAANGAIAARKAAEYDGCCCN